MPKTSFRPTFLLIAITLSVFVYLCIQYDVTQDDAYISFRYAANFLNGDGLVYNSGERVEGYTNFLWIMLLVIFKQIFSIDFILTAKILGILFGAAIFLLAYLLIYRHSEKGHNLLFAAAGIMLLSHLPLPYWSTSGLETSAFACIAFAALIAELRAPAYTPLPLVIATLLRPEGALLCMIIIINRMLKRQPLPMRFFAFYLLALFPWAVFKLTYYGSLIPNPFYAKSGFGFEYIKSGLEYLWNFFSTVGVYGLIFVIPLLSIKSLWRRYSLLYIFSITYIAYIVLVGGDVLKVYRFFLPVIPVIYFLFIISVNHLLSSLRRFSKLKIVLTLSAALAFAVPSFLLSEDQVKTYRALEKGLVDKMQFTGAMLRKHMGSEFSVAASTIGVLGYELQGHRVIDILGLTDNFIARNPEIISGLRTTWKERRFNNRYLLAQQPNFVIFSTNDKPSAPAELALMLHSEFRRNYSPTAFPRDAKGKWAIAFMRHGQIEIDRDITFQNVRFVNAIKEGYNLKSLGDYKGAIAPFETAARDLKEEYPLLLTNIGECLYMQKYIDSAQWYFYRALKLDPFDWHARLTLIHIAEARGDTTGAREQISALMRVAPWVFDFSYTNKSPDNIEPTNYFSLNLDTSNNSIVEEIPPTTVNEKGELLSFAKRDSLMQLNELAAKFMESGNKVDAWNFLSQSLAIDSSDLMTYHYLIAYHRQFGASDDLKRTADLMANRFSRSARGQMDAGMLFIELGDTERGSACLERAYSLDSNDVFVVVNCGVYGLRQGDYREAVRLLNRAVIMSPDYFNANFNLGLAYGALRDGPSAAKYLSRAQKLAATPAESSQVAGILKRLRP